MATKAELAEKVRELEAEIERLRGLTTDSTIGTVTITLEGLVVCFDREDIPFLYEDLTNIIFTKHLAAALDELQNEIPGWSWDSWESTDILWDGDLR